MASGVDLYLEGLRGVGASARNLGDDIVTAKKITAEKEDKAAKQEAERLRQERLGEVADAVPELNEKIKDPNYSREQFAADTEPFVQEAIRAGDTNSLQSLQYYKDIFDSRDKLDLADQSETPAERRAARAAERASAAKDKADGDLKTAATAAGDKLNATSRDYKDAIEAGEDSYNLLDLAKKEPAARGAAVRRLARAAGDKGVLSDKDVESFGGSEAVKDKLERIFTTAVSGTMTEDDAKYLQNVATKINGVSRERFENYRDTEVKRFTKNWGGDYATNYERLTGEAAPTKKTAVAKGKDKPAEDKNSELTDAAGGKDKPKTQVVTLGAYQKIREKKASRFKAGIEKLNAWRASQNPPLPPVTGAELRRSELEIAKRMNIQVAPDVEKSVIGGN